jgi:hypothetical protein
MKKRIEDLSMDSQKLNFFIVRAKAATYVGGGEHAPSCRPDSHDLKFSEGDWSYLDSYFGGRDFIGEEVVYFATKPVWAMNYYGRIIRDDLITPAQAGQVIKISLSQMYLETRFLGGFEYTEGEYTYLDSSEGDFTSFHGREIISRNGILAYELGYHGGLIKSE